MFRDDFVWGVASSAYQIEGTDDEIGCGAMIWDKFIKDGGTADGLGAEVTCDHIHRYKDDYKLMNLLSIKANRFSISWSRLIPDGIGEVNKKAVALYRDMILEMKKNGVEPYLTMYHWEFPQALQDKGGWLNEEVIQWFGYYAKVVSENFSDICENFITLNEPECFVGIGHLSGWHAPGLKLSQKEVFLIAHNALRAHGQAVINLRKYAVRPIKVGYAPTCGMAYPYDPSKPEDIEAAKKVLFGFYEPMDNWTWNVAWFNDPVFLGKYPENGIEKFKEFLPEITKEDMELISQPLDFMGQNIYNGYFVAAAEDGEPVFVKRKPGYDMTFAKWPVTPDCIYWGLKFISERYKMPIYVTENGMSCHDAVSLDGKVHDPNRQDFLDRYLSKIQQVNDEGADIRGYFLWTFLDNFEWDKGYTERFGIVHVDFETQKRTVKDTAFWYKDVIESNGETLSINKGERQILFLEPVLKEAIWGGTALSKYGYDLPSDKIGECWAIAAHEKGSSIVKEGKYKGVTLSELFKNHPELFGNINNEKFPLLVKIISAKEDLSIQVHPNDEYAKKNENGSLGKTECWYVLDCDKNAELVIGHNAKTREELVEMIENNKWDQFISKVQVKPGDFIQINPGAVHAIRGGITVLETQQNSDITYRVYDYDRVGADGSKRELHIKQCIDVINVPATAQNSIENYAGSAENEMVEMISCDYYTVWKIDVNGSMDFIQDRPFMNMSVIDGEGLVNGMMIKKGDHFIIPCGMGMVNLLGEMKIIASSV